MVMFHSYVKVYQRINHHKPSLNYHVPMVSQWDIVQRVTVDWNTLHAARPWPMAPGKWCGRFGFGKRERSFNGPDSYRKYVFKQTHSTWLEKQHVTQLCLHNCMNMFTSVSNPQNAAWNQAVSHLRFWNMPLRHPGRRPGGTHRGGRGLLGKGRDRSPGLMASWLKP